jgi:hypothetical protein
MAWTAAASCDVRHSSAHEVVGMQWEGHEAELACTWPASSPSQLGPSLKMQFLRSATACAPAPSQRRRGTPPRAASAPRLPSCRRRRLSASGAAVKPSPFPWPPWLDGASLRGSPRERAPWARWCLGYACPALLAEWLLHALQQTRLLRRARPWGQGACDRRAWCRSCVVAKWEEGGPKLARLNPHAPTRSSSSPIPLQFAIQHAA